MGRALTAMFTFLQWTTNVKDLPWSHVHSEHESGTQAFVEIIGKPVSDGKIEQPPFYFLAPYYPYFYASLPYVWTQAECATWVQRARQACDSGKLHALQLFYRNRQPLHTCLPTKLCTVVKFTFRSVQDTKAFAKRLVAFDSSVALWETPKTVPDTLKVAMTTVLKPCTWIDVPMNVCKPTNVRFTKHCREWFVPSLGSFRVSAAVNPVAAITILSFDLECYSQSGKFPQAKLDDPIIMIGNCLMTLVNGKPLKTRNIMYCLHEAKPGTTRNTDAKMELRCFESETDMLLAWKRELFDNLDVDIVTGWNIYQFDLPYLRDRVRRLIHDDSFYFLGRKLNDQSRFREEKEKTQKKKKFRDEKVNIPCPLQMFGRVIVDMMLWMKKLPTQFKAYKLDSIAGELLGRHKIDLKAWQIFDYFRSKDPHKIYELAEYCYMDCYLVLEIMVHQDACNREIAMAQMSRVEIVKVVTCGQQLKCFNLVMCFGYPKKYVCNYTAPKKSVQEWFYPKYDEVVEDDDEQELKKFKGATVLTPKAGFYRQPVIVLDFESKYPTEMKSHNLGSDTFLGDESSAPVFEPWLCSVPKDEWSSNTSITFDASTHFRTFWKLAQDKRFANVDDEWKDVRPSILKVINGPKEWSYFATSFASVVSETVTYLKEDRGKYKKQMKAAKEKHDVVAEGIANACQLAIKVIMNSLYGMFGANPEKAFLPCRRVAMSVTSIGREEIAICKAVTQREFKCDVIYGDTDSIFVALLEFLATTVDRDVPAALELGEKIANYITNVAFNKKAILSLEKVFYPFWIPKKKTYNGAKYEPKKVDGKYVADTPTLWGTGTVTNKRDPCDVHKEIFETMVQFMIMENNIRKAYKHLVFSLERMANNWYAMGKKFTCRNKLSNKDNVNIKSVRIRDKIKARMPGSEPRPGDIVAFVYVRHSNPKAKVLDTIEDVDFVQQTGAILDLNSTLNCCAHMWSVKFRAHTVQRGYFTRFPSLEIPKLFDKAAEVSMAYAAPSLFQTTPGTSQFELFMRKILLTHLRDHLHLSSESITSILGVWSRHFRWNPLPAGFQRPRLTNEMLGGELEREMAKHANDTDEKDEEENEYFIVRFLGKRKCIEQTKASEETPSSCAQSDRRKTVVVGPSTGVDLGDDVRANVEFVASFPESYNVWAF